MSISDVTADSLHSVAIDSSDLTEGSSYNLVLDSFDTTDTTIALKTDTIVVTIDAAAEYTRTNAPSTSINVEEGAILASLVSIEHVSTQFDYLNSEQDITMRQ